MRIIVLCLLVISTWSFASDAIKQTSVADFTKDMMEQTGFFDFYYQMVPSPDYNICLVNLHCISCHTCQLLHFKKFTFYRIY